MSANRGRQVHERVELLELTRAGDRQQAFDGAFAVFAARAEHDFSPLDRGSKRALGGVVGRLDALLVHEGEEMLIVHEERASPSSGRRRWPR